MLTVTNLSLRRGERLLFTTLNFQLPAGALLHVRGRNGSGKTTLLRALCGLLPIEQGDIQWRGQTLTSLAEDYYQDLFFLGHLNGIKGDLTALENLRVAGRLTHNFATEIELQTALNTIGLMNCSDLPTRILSQGQKKRVALARLIFSRAALWILDEPFTALDIEAVALVQQLITNHIKNGGSVILTTHQEVALTSGTLHQLDLTDYSPVCTNLNPIHYTTSHSDLLSC
ncbi:cytochrome c biogenesis heme-transporting ATPase CcmA [Rhodoferax sp. 4810]|uniref:Cytochrome c biogenesis heme-transporting ATPase CcmA n=1 Tax=Thiospirillum jenense TaxID=1653858 RepID=A0A839H5Y0_9GAMM|nr:cytochrome c biogenesis heme-transporting ATPase CcmA [Thiospirillum jenense]MBB1074219.1 cytochrome c biogenesis heme-transporting ATPase CcmA [Rhodoferax jenense]MBB1125293.1 cytochrome c biogenesis heme-transporting ATPase CcmA [Thiospirillum jenense]